MISKTLSHHPEYRDNWFDPVEFINRGKVRTEKDHNLEQAARVDEFSRRHLKKKVQELFQRMLDREKKVPQAKSKEPSKPINFLSKFFKGLKGTERELRLIQIRDKAIDHDREACVIRCELRCISDLLDAYEKNAARFLDVTDDAIAHHIHTSSGWTWWR